MVFFGNFSRYTDKSDIFSFGMILGVLLTGKDPTDPFFGEAASGEKKSLETEESRFGSKTVQLR